MIAINTKKGLRDFLEKKVLEYNHPSFIGKVPVSIPHGYIKKQDIEIAGLFAAVFSWGNRTTIIRKSNELMEGMENAPHDFILNHQPADLRKLFKFKHRTFNTTDLLYFIQFLKSHYLQSDTLESAFLQNPLHKPESAFLPNQPYEKKANSLPGKIFQTGSQKANELSAVLSCENEIVKNALSLFYTRFFSLEDAPRRTQKHISSPEKNSTCKRLNMYLRWMVRKDNRGVDFGIWEKISAADLICPVDLHVARVARGFGLIDRKQTDWQTAMELTRALRVMDKNDPVKYDFALFGLGVAENY
jgi:uncharacterized protein (TIGR02757 family)